MQGRKVRLAYLLFAITCMVIFIVGSFLVNNRKEINSNGLAQYEQAQEVFKYEEENKTKDNLILLKLSSKSTSFISLYFKEKFEKYSSVFEYLKDTSKLSKKAEEIVRSQFPTIISLNRNPLNVGRNKYVAPGVGEKPKKLEDLIFIEDLMEQEEGELLDEEEAKEIDKDGIPKPVNVKPLKVDKEKPYILIYHTHTTEAYLPIKQNQSHTQDENYNVIPIGKIIENVLTKRGHKVRHLCTYHDIPSYNKSYAKSLSTVNVKMKEEPNLKVIFDIHRDGVPGDASYKNKAMSRAKVNIDGKDVATFSLVIGPDSENMNEVLNFAKYIKSVSDTIYPGFCKGIIVKPMGRFNQFVSNYSALIEVGSNLNTIEEAKEASKLLGEVLSIAIENIQE